MKTIAALVLESLLLFANGIPNPNGPECHALRQFDCDGGTVGNPTDNQVYFSGRVGLGMTCSDLVINNYPYICKQSGDQCNCQPPFIGGVCRENFLAGYIEFEGYWDDDSCDDSFDQICSTDRCSSDSDRLLAFVDDGNAGKEEKKELAKLRLLCDGDVAYHMHLQVVDSHFYAIGVPDTGNLTFASSCPIVTTNVHFDLPERKGRKELIAWDNTAESRERTMGLAETLSVATVSFSSLLKAYSNVDIFARGSYNVVSNNCATFLLDMAQGLHLSLNHNEILSFVTRRLAEDASPMLTKEIGKHVLKVGQTAAARAWYGLKGRVAPSIEQLIELSAREHGLWL